MQTSTLFQMRDVFQWILFAKPMMNLREVVLPAILDMLFQIITALLDQQCCKIKIVKFLMGIFAGSAILDFISLMENVKQWIHFVVGIILLTVIVLSAILVINWYKESVLSQNQNKLIEIVKDFLLSVKIFVFSAIRDLLQLMGSVKFGMISVLNFHNRILNAKTAMLDIF